MELTMWEWIEKNRTFLKKWASYYTKLFYSYGIEYEDLYQVGCLALIESYPYYQKEKGSLSSYSNQIIKYQMLEYVNQNNTITHIGKGLKELYRKLNQENSEFYKKNGRNMNLEESLSCLERINKTSYQTTVHLLRDLECMLAYHQMSKRYSLEELVEVEQDENEFYQNEEILNNVISDDYNLEEECCNQFLVEELIKILRKIHVKEQNIDIFIKYLGLEKDHYYDLQMLAEEYGISYQAIDRRYQRTLNKMRKNIELVKKIWES